MTQHRTWVNYFLGFDKCITSSAVFLSTAGLALASLIGLYQVIARFVLYRAAEWSEPLIQMSLIWMTYLGLAGAMRSGTLISVDWLLTTTKGRSKKLLKRFILLAVLTLLAFIAWYGISMVLRVQSQTIAGLGIRASWAYAALPAGAIISMIAVSAHTLDPRSNVDHQTENA